MNYHELFNHYLLAVHNVQTLCGLSDALTSEVVEVTAQNLTGILHVIDASSIFASCRDVTYFVSKNIDCCHNLK